LQVRAAGYRCDRESFLVESSEPIDLGTIQLRKASAALSVTLTRAGGAPLGRPVVCLKDLDRKPLASLTLEGNRASSRTLDAGTYLLRVEESGRASVEQRVTLRDEEELKLEFELPALPK
jgi:hypothetical protein